MKEPKPLTDEELARIERVASEEQQRALRAFVAKAAVTISAEHALGLVAEVRRLRSDEWLRAAAEEIAAADRETMRVIGRRETEAASSYILAAILRKHRDGDAKGAVMPRQPSDAVRKEIDALLEERSKTSKPKGDAVVGWQWRRDDLLITLTSRDAGGVETMTSSRSIILGQLAAAHDPLEIVDRKLAELLKE